jgi:hypothetical protein
MSQRTMTDRDRFLSDPPPRPIQLVAGVFAAFAIGSAIDHVVELSSDDEALVPPEMLLLVVAYGLWRRHAYGRIGALIVAWLIAIGLPSGLLIAYLGVGGPELRFFGIAVPRASVLGISSALSSAGLAVAVSIWTIRILTREEVHAEFHGSRDMSTG